MDYDLYILVFCSLILLTISAFLRPETAWVLGSLQSLSDRSWPVFQRVFSVTADLSSETPGQVKSAQEGPSETGSGLRKDKKPSAIDLKARAVDSEILDSFGPRDLLDGLNEAVTLKDTLGRYRYVNAAFIRLVGRLSDDIIGRDDTDVFGFVNAQTLAAADHQARLFGNYVSIDEIVDSENVRSFEVSRQMLGDEEAQDRPIISVWRERSELLHRTEARERAMQQTIAAFARSIRFVDPYLGDHAQRLARVAQAVARQLGGDDKALMTVEYAALLSQVGKLSVSIELLCKPCRLSPEETVRLQRHVDDTATLLAEFEFGLPVAEAVHQMHERLDGTGYPSGLKGEEIKLSGRILGACDVFCARISPRIYRSAIPAEEALTILKQNPHRYDSEVVAALARVIQDPKARGLFG